MQIATILLLLTGARAVNVAIARISGSTAATPASGWVRFEQDENDPLADVTVRINVSGIPAGQHGFHIHQFGDVRSTTDLSSMSAHFVPFCNPPELEPDSSGNLEGGCANDQQHGLPPSIVRQPGDMGNVLIAGAGATQTTLTIGQQKMSLTDPLRSIVGRTVVFHTLADDGSQPYGNAGPPLAYGVIGMARPSAGVTNGALAPTVPEVDKIICTFEGAPAGSPEAGNRVTGSALLQLLQPDRPDTVRMQARIEGLSSGSTHSFHFHTWGDMTVAYTQLGDIYASNSIEVEHLDVDSTAVGYFQGEFATSSLLQHVGRSLTIHQGSSASTPTIAAATCGLANPRAKLDMTGSPFEQNWKTEVSGGAMSLVFFTAVVCIIVFGTGLLYYMRLPIPICGRWLYAQEHAFGSMPPPPPPPDVEGIYMRQEKV